MGNFIDEYPTKTVSVVSEFEKLIKTLNWKFDIFPIANVQNSKSPLFIDSPTLKGSIEITINKENFNYYHNVDGIQYQYYSINDSYLLNSKSTLKGENNLLSAYNKNLRNLRGRVVYSDCDKNYVIDKYPNIHATDIIDNISRKIIYDSSASYTYPVYVDSIFFTLNEYDYDNRLDIETSNESGIFSLKNPDKLENIIKSGIDCIYVYVTLSA